MKGIGTIDWATMGDAALMAAIGAVAAAAVSLIGNGFDIFSADWVSIGKMMTNVAVAAAVLSVGKDLVSNNQGQVLGLGKPYTK